MSFVRVEFFGIARRRTGVAETRLDLPPEGASLGEVLARLGAEFPAFARDCLAKDRLRPGFTANLEGERFLSDPAARLSAGQALLIMSADAGG